MRQIKIEHNGNASTLPTWSILYLLAVILLQNTTNAEPFENLFSGEKGQLLSPAVAFAIETEDTELLSVLKKREVDFNVEMTSVETEKIPAWSQRQPLSYAVLLNSIESVRWLLRNGAKPDSVSTKGERPIDWLVKKEGIDQDRLAVANILARENNGGLDGAIAEMARCIRNDLVKVDKNLAVYINRGSASRVWLEALQGLAPKLLTGDKIHTHSQEHPSLEITVWDAVDENTVRFNWKYSAGGLNGTGMLGEIVSKFGYWFVLVKESWDS